MSNRKYIYLLFIFSFNLFQQGYSQSSKSNIIVSVPDKVFASIYQKSKDIEDKLERQAKRYLTKIIKQEINLKKKLSRKDSIQSVQLFGGIESKYKAIYTASQKYNTYHSHLDSLTSAIKFLKIHNTISADHDFQEKTALQSLQRLQDKLDQADYIQSYLHQRQQQLKQQFQKLGMGKELKRYQKQVYYYRTQVQAYKQVIQDPNKWEAKLIEIALKMPQFKDFFARNSQLSSLFALPTTDGSSTVSLQGLQTRAMLNEYLAQRFGSGADVAQMLQQNVQGAQSQLSALKNKASQYTRGSYSNTSSEIDQPDFRPNTQKAESFLKRLELGGNLQSQKARSYFPITSDIGATLGYKLNDKSSIGVGAAYKVGWGSGIQHIKITHQGVGLRSYVDLKLKGSVYVSGGYELNYQSLINSVEQLKNFDAWQKSGLVGLTKRYSISKKIKGNMQLLWDFLSYQQVPRTQAVLFRVGYSIK